MKKLLFVGLMSLIMGVVQASSGNATFASDKAPDTPSKGDPNKLTVMAWNIWGRSNMEEKHKINGVTARQRVIDIIKDSGADIIGMIETYGSAEAIAKALGYYYYTPSSTANLCIFSRYPLSDVGTPKGLSSFSYLYATATLPSGQKVRIYDIWLTYRHAPNSCPYDSTLNPDISNERLVAADRLRAEMINDLLKHPKFKEDMARVDEIPLVVGGDFNYISHLDYTKETAALGLHDKRILPIPTSLAMAKHDFIDTYRHCNPLKSKEQLGYTWSTMYKPRKEWMKDNLYKRIDYIYSLGKGLHPTKSWVVTRHRSNPHTDDPYFPSDHAAVVTIFKMSTL